MKKYFLLIIAAFCVGTVWLMAGAWDETTPQDSESVSQGASRIREFKAAYWAQFNVDHYLPLSESSLGDSTGYHKDIHMVDSTATDTEKYGGVLRSVRDTYGVSHMWWFSNTGVSTQLDTQSDPGTFVHLTGTDTIHGNKTFTDLVTFDTLPQLNSNPQSDTEAVRKAYVDTQVLSSAVRVDTAYATGETSTNSITFVDLSGMVIYDTNTSTAPYEIDFHTTAHNTYTTTEGMYFALTVDSTTVETVLNESSVPAGNTQNEWRYVGLHFYTILPAGVHTFKIRWVAINSNTVYAEFSRVMNVKRYGGA